jgi:hypothetical protein
VARCWLRPRFVISTAHREAGEQFSVNVKDKHGGKLVLYQTDGEIFEFKFTVRHSQIVPISSSTIRHSITCVLHSLAAKGVFRPNNKGEQHHHQAQDQPHPEPK